MHPLDAAFSSFHADILVQQADDLLTRCLRDRVEWEDKFLKAHQFLSDLDQFERLDAIHRREEAQGFYDLDAQLSAADLRAARAMQGWLTFARHALSATADRVRGSRHEQEWAAQLLAWLSHISGYQKGQADNTVKVNEVEKKVIEQCFESAGVQVGFELANEQDRVDADVRTRSGEIESLGERLSGLSAKASWEKHNTQFRRLRTDVLRSLYILKRQLVTEPAGALNFEKRLESIRHRCARDFRDALARMSAAAVGLRDVFGYDRDLPESVRFLLGNPATPLPTASALDDALQWVRDAAAWLVRFQERDHVYTPTFSLRDLLGCEPWRQFLLDGHTRMTVGESLFPGQRFVRLRGVALHTEGIRGFLPARIRVPTVGISIQSETTVRTLNQKSLGALRIGAVRPYQSPRLPETVGISGAYNASPLGEWEIALGDTSAACERRRELEDVYLELSVAYQSH